MELTSKDDNLRHTVPFVRQITENGQAKLEIYRPTTNPIYIYTQVSDSKVEVILGFCLPLALSNKPHKNNVTLVIHVILAVITLYNNNLIDIELN